MVLWYNDSSGGADIAFDNWTLTGYFASRFYTLRIFLIANFFAKAKTAIAKAFTPMQVAFAPVANIG